MEQINIIRKGTALTTIDQEMAKLSLIDRVGGMEIMINEIEGGRLGIIYAGDDPNLFEFFHVVQGTMTLTIQNKDIYLEPGDSFRVQQLESQIVFKTEEAVKLLYLSNGRSFDDLIDVYDLLENLLTQIQEKDLYTREHCRNVMHYSTLIAKQLQMSQENINELMYAAVFHDIGKAKIPSRILKKEGKLTDEEYTIMKQHAKYSYEILKDTFGKQIASIASKHHERLDGKGYPYGLTIDEIPLEARILSVADAYDAMTSKRTYKDAMSQADAFDQLRKYSDTQFDSVVVNALIIALEKEANQVEEQATDA
ncbi:MAG: HD-GYP domain-containing protein [Erysipelotrichaceae bacterium]